jgi:hypothetical protein
MRIDLQHVLARLLCAGFAVVLVAIPVLGAGNPVVAVWRERHIDFVYVGRTARYSCDGLRDKVRAMLLDLGARRDLKIAASGCEGEDRLRIMFFAPALPDSPAKPLLAGDLASTAARFVAFTLTSDAFRNMGLADCELVQEFARQILPTLVTRNVRQEITCMPMSKTGSRFWVRGEVLHSIAER